MILKTVYKKNGEKVQKWSIEVQEDKYRSTEGFVGGAMTTSQWTKVEGKNIGRKNETTPAAQALKEAGAKYRLKIDKGYSEDEHGESDIKFEPMLAHSYGDHKAKVQFPCYVQPKLDGMRCPVRADGMFSRQNKAVTAAPHIWEALKHLFEEFPGLVVDGELYNHKLKSDFNEIISIVRKKKLALADEIKSRETIELHVYDMYDSGAPDMDFESRYLELLAHTDGLVGIVPVKTYKVADAAELDKMYEQFLEEGYEGIMIRTNGSYQQKRTTNLLKRKEFIDAEFTIIDILEGEGNRSGMMGKFVLVTDEGEKFEADGSGLGGHVVYEELLEDKALYLGVEATVRYQNLTPDRKVPRFGKVIAIRDYE